MPSSNATLRALAAITDAAEFERLASSVLRAAVPKLYANLSHPGVSPESGKTVRAPFDNVGWAEMQGESRFVCAAHTSCEQSGLRGKWLHDPATVKTRKAGSKPTQEAGDLVKGLEKIHELRALHPGVKVTFALTTNRETPAEVRSAAEQMAKDGDIDLDIWSASRLAQFLDTSAEGQVVRNQFLGTPIERVSRTLLVAAGLKSMSDHLQLPTEREYVQRAVVSIPAAHCLVVGASGMGKTSLCARQARGLLSAGQPALVLKHEHVHSATTMADAIELELRRQYPNLEAKAGPRALEVSADGGPMLVLVEDINRSEQPASVLNKLMAWTRSSSSGTWRLLCPVWPRYFDAIESKKEAFKTVEVLELGHYTDGDARDALRRRFATVGRSVDETEIARLATSLGNDPLLIGLYDAGHNGATRDVVSDYVDEKTTLIASAIGLMRSDVEERVDWLIEQMLLRREHAPTWAQIKEWSANGEHLSVLRSVMQDGSVLRLQQGERLASRHDRVLSYLFERVAAKRLRSSSLDTTFLDDPFIAESVGSGVVRVAAPEEALLDLMVRSPGVGFYALQAATEAQSSYLNVALSAAKTWLQKPDVLGDSALERRAVAASILAEIDSPLVLELVEFFPTSMQKHYYLLAARLRNGDAQAGLDMLAKYDLGSYVKGQRELLARAIRTSGDAMQALVAQVLCESSPSDLQRNGALHLAGYLATPVLAKAIRHSWTTDPRPRISYYLWAASRCCSAEVEETLGPVLDAWESLPEERGEGQSINDVPADSVRQAFKSHPPTAESVRYLIARAASSKKLAWPVTYLLKVVDLPDAAEYVSRYVAGMAAGQSRPRFHDVDWGDGLRAGLREMSSLTKERLLELALSEGNAPPLRKAAFDFWAAGLARDDVSVARSIGSDSLLYHRALLARVSRRDMTASEELNRMIEAKPSYWLQATRYFLPNDFLPVLARVMDKHSITPYVGIEEWTAELVAEVLLRIEPDQAEALLAQRWSGLGGRDKFVQVALLLATPKLLKLVAASVADSKAPKELFNYFMTHAEIWTGLQHGLNRPSQIRGLLPYLQFLSASDIRDVWRSCTENGWVELRQREVDPLVKVIPEREEYLEGEPVGTGELDTALSRHPVWTHEWLRRQMERGVRRDAALTAALQWATAKGTPEAVRLACDIFGEEATRSEFLMLEEFAREHNNLHIDVERVRFSVWRRTLT